MSFLFWLSQCQHGHHDDTANVDDPEDPWHVGMAEEGLNFDERSLEGHDQQEREEEQGKATAQKQADDAQKKADAMRAAMGLWVR